MSAPAEIRPRFELYVPAPADEVLGRIERHLERSGGAVRGWVKEPYAELRVPTTQRKVWSPRLAITTDDMTDGVQLCCRLQPEPEVWTAYIAIASALGVATISVAMYGLSQFVLGATPWVAVIGLPVVLVLGAVQYTAALLGQRLGREQMGYLQEQLLEALADLSPKVSDAPS